MLKVFRSSPQLVLGVALILYACGGAVSERKEQAVLSLDVGQPFPSIVLPSLADGSPASVDQFRGQKLLLHVFASW